MRFMRLRWLQSGWPLASVIAVFLIGLAADGLGGAVLAAALATLVFGPAYLIQNYVRQRRGTLVMPPPKPPTEKARADARLIRAMAIGYPALGLAAIAAALIARGAWLPRPVWTLLLISAAAAIGSAPYLWGLAEARASHGWPRWGWVIGTAVDLVLGLGATVVAITNQQTHWIGGVGWTIALCVLGVYWLLGAVVDAARARATSSRNRL